MNIKVFIAGVFACLIIGAAVQGQTTNGLVAYYPFLGNANDFGPNGLHGTVHGATLASDRAGRPNMAYSFNGSNAYIDLGDSAWFRPTNEVTLSLWACADWTNIFSSVALAGNTQNGGYALHTHVISTFASMDGVVILTGNYSDASKNLASLTPGWHHFAFAGNNKNLQLYVDGKRIVATAASGSIKYSYNNNFLIGAEAGAAALPEGGYFTGSIDEVRIYDRALSQNEIAFLNELPDVPPDIAVERAVLFSWDAVPGNYRLELAPTAGGPWTASPGTAALSDGRWQIAVPSQAVQPYSRLVRIE